MGKVSVAVDEALDTERRVAATRFVRCPSRCPPPPPPPPPPPTAVLSVAVVSPLPPLPHPTSSRPSTATTHRLPSHLLPSHTSHPVSPSSWSSSRDRLQGSSSLLPSAYSPPFLLHHAVPPGVGPPVPVLLLPVLRADHAAYPLGYQFLYDGFSSPYDVATDSSGNIYVADRNTATVFKLNPQANGSPSVYYNNTTPALNQPDGLCLDNTVSPPTCGWWTAATGVCSSSATPALSSSLSRSTPPPSPWPIPGTAQWTAPAMCTSLTRATRPSQGDVRRCLRLQHIQHDQRQRVPVPQPDRPRLDQHVSVRRRLQPLPRRQDRRRHWPAGAGVPPRHRLVPQRSGGGQSGHGVRDRHQPQPRGRLRSQRGRTCSI